MDYLLVHVNEGSSPRRWMSILAKSSPMNSRVSLRESASAQEKQSPWFNTASYSQALPLNSDGQLFGGAPSEAGVFDDTRWKGRATCT
jgi:hypothetical protein